MSGSDSEGPNLPVLPDLVLLHICRYLNISEVKSFRKVCWQWNEASLMHIENRGCIHFNSQFRNFEIYANSTEYCPVRNLKFTIYPKSFGCKCDLCNVETPVPIIDESILETIIGKCSAGIKFFQLETGQRHVIRTPPHVDFTLHDIKIDLERLLLREEFQILRELRIVSPFQLTNGSAINSVFQKLTHLYMTPECRKNLFAEKVLKQCSSLKSLTIGWEDVMYKDIVREGEVDEIALGILDALTNVKKEKEFNVLEELKIDTQIFAIPTCPISPGNLFMKIQNLDLNLTVLHVPMIVMFQHDNKLIEAIKKIFESRKEYLVSVVLPYLWVTIEMEDFPIMKSLKEFQVSVNFKLPMLQLAHKFPVLKSLRFTDSWIVGLTGQESGGESGDVLTGLSGIENLLSQDVTPWTPCETVSVLHVDFVRNRELLVALSKIFPSIQILTVGLKSEALPTLWSSWPRLHELTLMVEYDHYDASIAEEMRHGIFVWNKHPPFDIESSKFHSGLIGMTVHETDALIESSVPFMTLNIQNCSGPSIRDLQGLRKLTLKTGMTCNVALMLAVLPMKSLSEVETTSCDITIDCVQHVLSSNTHIQRWFFRGVGYSGTDVTAPILKNETLDWKISSKYEAKADPTFKRRMSKWSQPSLEPRLCEKYGRGKCLYTTPYKASPPPSGDSGDS